MGDTPVLEGIQIDQTIIPTDESGRILIPYRSGAYAYPYISATDILEIGLLSGYCQQNNFYWRNGNRPW